MEKNNNDDIYLVTILQHWISYGVICQCFLDNNYLIGWNFTAVAHWARPQATGASASLMLSSSTDELL